jgi:hypothetical protein
MGWNAMIGRIANSAAKIGRIPSVVESKAQTATLYSMILTDEHIASGSSNGEVCVPCSCREGIEERAMWKKEESRDTQPTPTLAMYAEAMSRFRGSAGAFMEHVHLLTEARAAYREAIAVGTEIRNKLDAGEQTLISLMAQLEQVANHHLSEPALDRKKPELVKDDSARARNEGTGTGRSFP